MSREELTKRVYVREVKKEFHLEQISGNEESLNRWIIAPDVNRPGLELTGYVRPNDLKRCVILGNKEIEYIGTMDEQTQKERYATITDSYTPCIIISGDSGVPQLLVEYTREKNFPVFIYHGESYQLIVNLVSFLSEKLAKTMTMHGEMMCINGIGVMLMGTAGVGKSEIALDLITRGHMLVADDRVDVARVHNNIICTAPDLLKRLLEVRGLGIVDVNLLFGGNSFLEKCNLDLVIKFVPFSESQEKDRLNPVSETMDIFGITKPVVEIPVTEGKSMAAIIEATVTTFILKKNGVNTTETFKRNVYEEIQRKNKEKEMMDR